MISRVMVGREDGESRENDGEVVKGVSGWRVGITLCEGVSHIVPCHAHRVLLLIYSASISVPSPRLALGRQHKTSVRQPAELWLLLSRSPVYYGLQIVLVDLAVFSSLRTRTREPKDRKFNAGWL